MILGRVRRDIGPDRLGGDLLCGAQIFLHQDWREREHVADVVEAVADLVVGKVRRRLVVHAKKVADGVVVLAAVEAAQRDAAGVHRHARVRAVKLGQLRVDELGQQDALILGRLRLLLRRHLPPVQHVVNLLPRAAFPEKIRGGSERLEVHLRLGSLVAVATVAVLLEQRLDVTGKLRMAKRRRLGVFRLAKRLAQANGQEQANRSVEQNHH